MTFQINDTSRGLYMLNMNELLQMEHTYLLHKWFCLYSLYPIDVFYPWDCVNRPPCFA